MQFPLTLISGREFDVAGFGTNAVDFLIEVPEFPTFNSKIELSGYSRLAGGEIASTMVGLQRLGFHTAYAGRFGGDDAGSFGIRSLEIEGVDVSFCEEVETASTQVAFILIHVPSGERTVIWKRDNRLAYSENNAPLGLVSRSSVLHLSPHDMGAATAMAKEAKKEGTVVSIDIDRVSDGVNDLLPFVDILIASAEFPQMLTAGTDLRSALREIASRYGCSVVGATLGRDGSVLYSAGRFIATPGFGVPGGCRDTTGAGDAFRVGIIYGLLKGASIEESAVLANGVAALKCRAVGARTALPAQQELSEFIASAPGGRKI